MGFIVLARTISHVSLGTLVRYSLDPLTISTVPRDNSVVGSSIPQGFLVTNVWLRFLTIHHMTYVFIIILLCMHHHKELA